MIHVRIVTTYPPVFGLPEETIELTLNLPPEFARTGDEAHERIVEALKWRAPKWGTTSYVTG